MSDFPGGFGADPVEKIRKATMDHYATMYDSEHYVVVQDKMPQSKRGAKL